MRWEEQVSEWKKNPVTIAFFDDLLSDQLELVQAIIEEDDPNEVFRLQGMLKAYRGILDVPDVDGIPSPKQREGE